MSHSVELAGIGMTFGTTRAVSDVSFKVEAGEFFSILGPSGCGKTTILRMIAGFIEPTEGRVLIGDREHDVLGAHEVGIDSIGVRWGYAEPGELTAAAPTAIRSAGGRELGVTNASMNPATSSTGTSPIATVTRERAAWESAHSRGSGPGRTQAQKVRSPAPAPTSTAVISSSPCGRMNTKKVPRPS